MYTNKITNTVITWVQFNCSVQNRYIGFLVVSSHMKQDCTNLSHTATILLGSTFTLMNIVSSFTKCLFFSISWETNRGKPKPSESGSLLGRWKFFHVGSGIKLSTMLQACSKQFYYSPLHITIIMQLFLILQNFV